MESSGDLSTTLSEYKDLYFKLVNCLNQCVYAPHLRSAKGEQDGEIIAKMDHAATAVTRGVECDVQNVYHTLCTSECPFITTASATCQIFFCVDHANMHYCGIYDCDTYTDGPGGRTCTLTGTCLDASGYLIDDCLASSYTRKPKKRDDDGGGGGGGKGRDSDTEDGPSKQKTRALTKKNRFDKELMKEWTRSLSGKKTSLFDRMKRIGIESARCTRKRTRHQGCGVTGSKGDEDEEEDDDDDDDRDEHGDDEFSADVYHHRREPKPPAPPDRKTADGRRRPVATSTVAASRKRKPVTEEMLEKQRPMFRSANRPTAASAAATVATKKTAAATAPTPPTSKASTKASRARMFKREEEAHDILRRCIECRNRINDKKNFDDQLPTVEATQEDLKWFGTTCRLLWSALAETPQFQKSASSFPYLCLFVLLNVARDGLHCRIPKDGVMIPQYIHPNETLLSKAPTVSDIQHITHNNNGQFTNRSFTLHQRRILAVFAADQPGETERRKRARLLTGGTAADNDGNGGDSVPDDDEEEIPDITSIIINQPSKVSVVTTTTTTTTATTTTAAATVTPIATPPLSSSPSPSSCSGTLLARVRRSRTPSFLI